MRLWPKASDANVRDGKLLVDSRGTDDGYIFASVSQITNKRLKLRISKDRDILTYDLNGNAEYELFSLQLGDGFYRIDLYENTCGKTYILVGSTTISVTLNDPNSPYLLPNQYVNYNEDSEVVKIADEICSGKIDHAAFLAIQNYIRSNYSYDFIRALTVKKGTLPDIDATIRRRSGICQDLAALAVAMLRTQGIPAKLVIGYADKQYHAWVSYILNETEHRYDPTAEIRRNRSIKTYSIERTY